MEDLQSTDIIIKEVDRLSPVDPRSNPQQDDQDHRIEDEDVVTGESIHNEESIHSLHGGTCPCDHQFSMNVADYQLGAVIGFGSSAIVHMAKYSPLSMDVAIKMIELDHFERNRIDELRKEIQVMAFCKHPNLLGNLTSFVHESKLWIVTPFLAGGSCLDIMKSGFKDGFDEAIIATILVQALQGLEYLHENGHIHRDVKCGNLLMSEDGLVQLADFGVSSSLMEDGERQGVRKTYVGTPCWMAPEVMEITRGYDFKADIWSFGITALELAYGHAPYAKFPPMKVIYLTLSGKPPTLDKKQAVRKYSRMFKDMIDCCLQRDPSKRPTAKALLKHPFFRSMAKKPQYLVSSVLAQVPPVNLRDKSAQLRARGLPVPVIPVLSSADTSEDYQQQQQQQQQQLPVEEVALTTGNKSNSFLGQFVASADEADKNEDSWDFSIDNSVDPPEDSSNKPLPASVFDVITEEDEEDDDEEIIQEEEEGENVLVPIPKEEEIQIQSDFLPDARIIEPVESADVSFNCLQKSRTSRFILAADAEDLAVGEAINRLDLSTPVVDSTDQDEIVGSIIIGGGDDDCVAPDSTAAIISSEAAHLMISSAYRSASPNETGSEGTAPTNEVKKGRFSVLEAVNTSDVDPSIDDIESGNIVGNGSSVGVVSNGLLESGAHISSLSGPSPNNAATFAMEEEKRSRFEVSLNVPTAADTSDTEDGNTGPGDSALNANDSNLYQNQNNYHHQHHSHQPSLIGQYGYGYGYHFNPQTPPVQHFNNAFYPQSPYHHALQPQPPLIHPQQQQQQQIHQHRQSLTTMPFVVSSPGNANHPHHHLPQSSQHHSMSPVSAAQIDHLLHVNDYLRNQIIELKYRQDWLLLQHHQQQGMRPHSTFNPHINNGSNHHFNYPTSAGSQIHHNPNQHHHSHPIMPPAALSSDAIHHPPHPTDFAFNYSCYCCPPPSSLASQSNLHLVSISNSVSPPPIESSSTSSSNTNTNINNNINNSNNSNNNSNNHNNNNINNNINNTNNTNNNINAILKELESMKKENDILKAYLHQQQQQQQQQQQI